MKVTIDAPIGGLGDSLLFSTLPILYSRLGYRVYVTPRSVDNCRNREVADLLYDRNPYIMGRLEEQMADQVAGIKHERAFFRDARLWPNPIACIEALHGFPPHNDRPFISYTPKTLDAWADVVVIDPYSISQSFSHETFVRFVHRLISDEKRVVVLESKFHNGSTLLPMFDRAFARDIYEYIDIMASAKMFLCTESGSQSLAAAVREGDTYALCTTMHLNSRLYVWPNVNYTVTGKLSDDYLWNDLTAEGVGNR